MNVHIHYVVDLKLRRTHICWAHLPYLNSKNCNFWIDDKEEVSYEGAVYSFDLNEGCHQIKIKGYKSINICITKVFPVIHMWGEHSKWRIAQGKSAFWTPQSTEGNVTGIDFRPIH